MPPVVEKPGDSSCPAPQGAASTQSELESLTGADPPQNLLNKVIASTRELRESVDTLRNELAAGQLELRTAFDRLGHLEAEVARDSLTGLLNRRGFSEALEKLQTEGMTLTSASIFLLDFDYSRPGNDSFGHAFDDQASCATAKVLKSITMDRGVAARFGGQSFIVLLPGTPASGAAGLAEQILEALGNVRVRQTGSQKLLDRVTLSIGVATLMPGESPESAMERADRALYCAKNEGRNCV
jgi:diguanylate cyclase